MDFYTGAGAATLNIRHYLLKVIDGHGLIISDRMNTRGTRNQRMAFNSGLL
jgi:hypothetical protein